MIAYIWIGFLLLVFALLALDLGVFNRKAHVIGMREAFFWTAVWVTCALIFNVGVYFMYEHHLFGIGASVGHELTGKQASLQFLTGFIIEKSLSLDNIFVIALIFKYFDIPPQYQHRTLFWGILGAIIMRGIMIGAGVALIREFAWLIYVFGVLLIYTALKMMFGGDEKLDPDKNFLYRTARKIFPVSHHLEGQKFFTKIDGKRAITPMFLVLVLVESSDVFFAIDSIPAIFAVTLDPFIVFTSNIFAILGLRSLYFALSSAMMQFKYLKISIVLILGYVGVKMLLSHHFPIPTFVSLIVIAVCLFSGIVASVLSEKKAQAEG